MNLNKRAVDENGSLLRPFSFLRPSADILKTDSNEQILSFSLIYPVLNLYFIDYKVQTIFYSQFKPYIVIWTILETQFIGLCWRMRLMAKERVKIFLSKLF